MRITSGTFGLGTIDQPTPFQRSTRVEVRGVLATRALPTAKQLTALVQEIADSELKFACAAFGLGIMDQAEPSQCSTSVSREPESVAWSPTAKQSVVVTQCTASSWLFEKPDGEASIDQLVPSQRAASGLTENWNPTAMHIVVLVQETAVNAGPVSSAVSGLATIDQLVPS
ncbi:MAG: hypothetical protein ACXVL8_19540 [Acidimicrobiia bacterium]